MISAILLAAGQSKRMNGENKLIKKINGEPLIKHSVTNILESSIDELIIVTGYQNKILEKVIGKNKKIAPEGVYFYIFTLGNFSITNYLELIR